MELSDIDDLWIRPSGGPGLWYDRASDDIRGFVDQLVQLIKAKNGAEPTWAAVHRLGAEKFGDAWPKNVNTVSDTVRRLVKP